MRALQKILLISGCIAFILGYYMVTREAQADAVEDVRTFLNDLEVAVDKMETYRFISSSENWKGEKREEKVIRFQYKKPNFMRTDVLEGEKKGKSVLLNKEGKIRGRNALGFKTTLKPTDKRLKNIRGYTFMNSSLKDKAERLKEHILGRGCNAALTEEEYMGKPAYRLHIDHEDSDDEVTDEDVWFDKETCLILKNLKYENGTKVTDATWRDHEVNIPLDDSLFDF